MIEIRLGDHMSLDKAIDALKKDRGLTEHHSLIKLRLRNPKKSDRRRAKQLISFKRHLKQQRAHLKRVERAQKERSSYRSHRKTSLGLVPRSELTRNSFAATPVGSV